jgi:transposase
VEIHTIKPAKMAKSTRRRFTASFKTKVCLEALKERHSIEVLAKKFDIHPNQISAWKREFIERSEVVFEKSSADHGKDDQQKLIETLYARIGELTVANDFLKKRSDAVTLQPSFTD